MSKIHLIAYSVFAGFVTACGRVLYSTDNTWIERSRRTGASVKRKPPENFTTNMANVTCPKCLKHKD